LGWGNDIALIFDGACPQQHFPVIFARKGGKGGRYGDDFGAS
jgi:hypothetical protein